MTYIEKAPFLNTFNEKPFNKLNEISNGNNIDLILMEKDKEIINLSNLNISLKNQIGQLQKILKEKDMELNSLKSDLSTLNSDQKLREEENNILKNKLNIISEELSKKNKEIEIISSNNTGNMNNLNKAFDAHMFEYQKLFKNYNDLSSDLNKINEKYLDKEKECLLQQKVIHDLRNENKKIVILNMDIKDKEKQIRDLKNTIKNNNDEIFNHQKENKFLNEQIQNYSNNEEYLFKTRQNLRDYENIINDIKNNYSKKLKNKDLIINDYKNNILRNQANNENLISYIIQQIQSVQDTFEHYNSDIDDENGYSINNYSQITENDSKFELIHQNFVLLTQK